MEFIEVAKIINSHGIKGSVKIYMLTSSIDRFKNDIIYYIDKKIEVTIKEIRKVSNDIAILTFNEFNNINEILKFKNLGIYVEEKDVAPLPEDEFYVYKLIGLKVYNQENICIGKINNVLTTLANDVYEVKDDADKIYYIPAVKKFVKNIDIDNDRVDVIIIEGMCND